MIGLILRSLSPLEVREIGSGITAEVLSGLKVAEGALPPHIVCDMAVKRLDHGEDWFWCAPRLFVVVAEILAVGSGSFKGTPESGDVEIGYGVAESCRGRGYATRGVELMVTEAFSRPEITAVTAETAVTNAASQRVLEKASFVRAGSRDDPGDGDLILWRRPRSC